MIVTHTNLIEKLKQSHSIALVGLSKNAGKTTTLNNILKKADYKGFMLTSIGYDGEDTDLVFNSLKPQIFIKSNTIIATAKSCLIKSKVTFEILETTGYNTPLGEIVIARSMCDGYILLAGCSSNKQMQHVIDMMKQFRKDECILVDGALDRLSFSNPKICQETILCTGMNVDINIDKVVEKTTYQYELFKLKELEDDIKSKLFIDGDQNNLQVNDKDNNKIYNYQTSLEIKDNLYKIINEDLEYIYFNNIVSDNIALELLKYKHIFNKKIVINNSNSLFISKQNYLLLLKSGFEIRVINKINVCFISINPYNTKTQQTNYELENKLRDLVDISVIDLEKDDF